MHDPFQKAEVSGEYELWVKDIEGVQPKLNDQFENLVFASGWYVIEIIREKVLGDNNSKND